ncbi:hypothetical protein KXZ74_25835, partial [Escherichia coli]|nr:hypothetical protein [Escherichia coli]
LASSAPWIPPGGRKTGVGHTVKNPAGFWIMDQTDPAEKTRLYKAAQDIIWQVVRRGSRLVVEKLVSATQ